MFDFKTGGPYLWWSQHAEEFPILSKLAHRYLAAPATSVHQSTYSVLLEIYMTRKGIEFH